MGTLLCLPSFAQYSVKFIFLHVVVNRSFSLLSSIPLVNRLQFIHSIIVRHQQ